MPRKVSNWLVASCAVVVAGAAQAQEFDGAYAGVLARNNFNVGGNIDVGFGAFAGYNMDVGGGVVLGVEGEVDYDPDQPSPPFGGSVWSGGADDVTGTANLRVGTEVGGTLLYGKAGAGYSSIGDWVWGVGAGVDVPVAGDFFVRGEFQRLDTFTAPVPERYSAKVGVGMQF